MLYFSSSSGDNGGDADCCSSFSCEDIDCEGGDNGSGDDVYCITFSVDDGGSDKIFLSPASDDGLCCLSSNGDDGCGDEY